MNAAEISILERLAALGAPVQICNLSCDASNTLQILITRGYVQCSRAYPDNNLYHGVDIYQITAAGRVALADAKQATQEEANRKAEADRKKTANDAQAVIDKKKDHRHDFKVAAFTVILTLALEHITDIVDFVKRAFEAILLLLK